jgi:hypothetical protein
MLKMRTQLWVCQFGRPAVQGAEENSSERKGSGYRELTNACSWAYREGKHHTGKKPID